MAEFSMPFRDDFGPAGAVSGMRIIQSFDGMREVLPLEARYNFFRHAGRFPHAIVLTRNQEDRPVSFFDCNRCLE